MRPTYETTTPQLDLAGEQATANAGVGDAHDFYATPRWVTRAILRHLPRASSYLDPCCGTGEILEECGSRGWPSLAGIELNEARFNHAYKALEPHWDPARNTQTILHGDALTMEWPYADVIIQNPPFNAAEAFAHRALTRAAETGATSATLLRLAFLESAARVPFWDLWRPMVDIYVMAHRPSFVGGKTDNSAYCWLVSGPGRGGRYFHLTDSDPTKKRRGT